MSCLLLRWFSKLIRAKYPDLALHASTQMNIHNVAMAKTIQELGFKRIVLPREMNVDVIKEIKDRVDIELEVFVHGALFRESYFRTKSINEPCRHIKRGKMLSPNT